VRERFEDCPDRGFCWLKDWAFRVTFQPEKHPAALFCEHVERLISERRE